MNVVRPRFGVNQRPCPQCGEPMDRKSRRCKECTFARSPGPRCPRCGELVNRRGLCGFCRTQVGKRFAVIAFRYGQVSLDGYGGGEALIWDSLALERVYHRSWQVHRVDLEEPRFRLEREKARKLADQMETEDKEETMADETQAEPEAAEDLNDEILALEEEEGATPPEAVPPPLDLKALAKEADARAARMAEHGRKEENVARTFSGWVIDLLDANEAALSSAIRAEAEKRRAWLDTKSASEPYKRRTLASKVVMGEFDA